MGLADWYRDFITRQNPVIERSHHVRWLKAKPKPNPIIEEGESPDCCLCGIHPISTGKSKASIYARKKGMCGRCYGSGNVKKMDKDARMLKNGPCIKCGEDAIADGSSRHAARACRMKMCWKCYYLARAKEKK